ncbi:MAG: MFS transporter [Acidimicrobiales bacterium]
MSTLEGPTRTSATPEFGAAVGTRRGSWIDRWDPDDETFWETGGARIAKKNLVLSMVTDHLGFCIWVVWTIVVLNLADIGISLSVSEQFVLTLLPNLIGSVLRIPYTFAVTRFGGRAWTAFSATLLLLPALLLAVVVPSHWLVHQAHNSQMWVLALCAASAGVGGSIFASSMANISFFYPERKKGWALGVNAAGGNLGVAVAQLLVPLVVIVGIPAAAVKLTRHPVHLAYAGLIWLPFIVAAAVAAWVYMDSLTEARTDGASYGAALRIGHTWVLSFLYIGTFGSFIGYSFALPLVIKNSFPTFLAHHSFVATYLAGSVSPVPCSVRCLVRWVAGWPTGWAGPR